MVTATKGLSIHRSANVLTLVLKRFDVFTGGKITKVTRTALSAKRKLLFFRTKCDVNLWLFGLQNVKYPEYLDLHPFMSESKEKPLMYRLYAVLVHSGHSSTFGHYFCYIKVLVNFIMLLLLSTCMNLCLLKSLTL